MIHGWWGIAIEEAPSQQGRDHRVSRGPNPYVDHGLPCRHPSPNLESFCGHHTTHTISDLITTSNFGSKNIALLPLFLNVPIIFRPRDLQWPPMNNESPYKHGNYFYSNFFCLLIFSLNEEEHLVVPGLNRRRLIESRKNWFERSRVDEKKKKKKEDWIVGKFKIHTKTVKRKETIKSKEHCRWKECSATGAPEH